MTKRAYGRYTVETSNEDKLFFPEAGLTKGDLIDYYERIAETMLPHLRGRPLTMHRYPDGIEADGFYQKEAPDYFPQWIQRATIQKKEGGSQNQVLCKNAATLVYLADQACITPHVWLSRADDLHRPDRLIFDLDPPGERFEPVRRTARRLRDLLEELSLSSFVMLTGSRGAHVVVPLRRVADFDEVRDFARGTVKILAGRYPDELTIEQRKEKRGDRLFLDVARNVYAQTAVCPYSVRARAGASVATPIDWDELGASDLESNRYTVQNVFRRLAQRDDPWIGIARHAVGLQRARERLDELTSA